MSEEKVNKYIGFLTSKEAYKNYYAGNPKLEESVNGLIAHVEQKDNKINKTMDKAKQFKIDLKAYNDVRNNNYVPVGAIGIRINEILKILEE